MDDALDQAGEMQGANNVEDIGRDAEGDEFRRQVACDEAQRERIKAAAGEPEQRKHDEQGGVAVHSRER